MNAPPPPPSPASPARLALAAAALLALVALAHAPAFSAGFIWDDDGHLTPPPLRPAAGLARIWTEPGATQQYYPLLHSVFWLEHRLWGDAPLGYHAANVLFHAVVTLLFWRLLRSLAVPGAWLAAALFAVHPVHVESVAWISEQKNTLSAALALGAALAWVRFDATRRSGSWWVGFGLFAAALAAKTAVAPLPAALLVVRWWCRGQVEARRDAAPLLPWFVLAAGAGLFTAAVERHLIGAADAEFSLSLAERLVLAGRLPWAYLHHLAWPRELMFWYPRWTLDPGAPAAWLGAAASVAVTLALWHLRRRARGPLAVWLLFGGLLFPALGFVDIYPFRYSFVADHFAYLASLPVLAAAAAGGWAGARLAPRAALALGMLAVPVLAARTSQHARVFRDATTLYRHTLDRNPAAWAAWNNLGRELQADPARRDEAVRCFERALALRPDYYEARTNLGLSLAQSGRAVEALPHARRAVELQPASYQAHTNLGIALAGAGRVAEAPVAFRTAVALAPGLPNARENLAKALLLAGHREEAAAQFAAAARQRGGGR